jgi:hypothetical protein
MLDWDWRIDQRRNSFPCQGCGSPEPARVEGLTCSDCTEYPRCGNCKAWTTACRCIARCLMCFGDIEHGAYVRVAFPDGSVRELCDTCMERADDSSEDAA